MLGRYTTGPLRRTRSVSGSRAILRCPCPTSSTCVPTPSPIRPPRCAAPWRTQRSATTCSEDDPTVLALEERAAELLGKEAGLFVASGTMGNLVSQMAHVPRGGEIIADESSHIVMDEAAGHAVVVGASVRSIRAGADGTHGPQDIRQAFRDPTTRTNPSPPSSRSRTPTPIRWASRWARSTRLPWRAIAQRAGRAAPRGRGAPVQRGGRPGDASALARRERRFGHVLPVQGSRLPGRLGGGRVS